jgi:hypothetical protein
MIYANICEQDNENQYRSSEQIDETTNTETTEILIYPNPTNEILSVEFYGMKEINCVFEICDISGRIVLYHILNDIIMNIDVSKLAKGSYIYRINDKSGNLLKKDKLIIM